MRKLLLIAILALPWSGQSQFLSGNLSYLYNAPVGNPMAGGHGFQLGLGAENLRFDHAPFTFSTRYTFSFTKPQSSSHVDDIEFDLPDDEDNMGFADVDFKTFTFGLEFDLGFQKLESSIIEPYLTFGGRFSNSLSYLSYGLYNPDSCECYDTDPDILTETKSFGFTSGLGIKIRPTKSFYFDVRAEHFGSWGLRKNDERGMPDPESFHIDAYGSPRFQYSEGNYFSAINFKVGIIFRINFDNSEDDSWYYTSGGGSKKSSGGSSSDDDDDDSGSSSSSGGGSSSSSSKKECTPKTLKPKGRGN